MHRIAIATALTLLLAQTWAMAIPITYIETATATGGLGSRPFYQRPYYNHRHR